MSSPYRDTPYMTAQEARLVAIENADKKLQRLFAGVMNEIQKACEKGDCYAIFPLPLTGDTRIRLAALGYKIEMIWTDSSKVCW